MKSTYNMYEPIRPISVPLEDISPNEKKILIQNFKAKFKMELLVNSVQGIASAIFPEQLETILKWTLTFIDKSLHKAMCKFAWVSGETLR